MHSPFKKPKSKEGDINQQLSNTIYKKVTAENYQENQDETSKECKRLFKQGASPKTLAELEKILRERQNEQAIAKHLESSKQGTSPEALAELEKSVGKKREHYNNYIQHFLPALKAEITESKKLDSKKKAAIVQTILDITNRSSSVSSIPNAVEENIEDQMQLKHIEEQNNTQETPLNVAEKKSGDNKILSNSDVTEEVFEKCSKVVKEIEEKQTSKLSSGNDSDSGIDSPRTSKESLKSPVSSRRSSLTLVTSTSSEESLNSTLSSVEGDNGLQPEDEGETKLAHLTKTRSKGPSGRRSPSKHHEKKDPMQPEEKEEKAVSSKQEASKDILSKKQSNDRNLHVALAAGCALLAVGCLVAAAIAKLGILCVIGAVFAIEAITTWYLTPSSELTSTNLSRPVDDKSLQHVRSGKN
ncbi:hypothetical protein [Wolbachia endosymbiont (group A) of Epistrophe grossularia]|uniref:hypothetical protein n=1 Tax=Wolbachia endosymbiont (group A) of Epistrophe grossularia TaxID=2954008 RepID=UPI002231FADB|nr:hypothetical protein [Wolbachia endosymbiont (group A) of Epistrophe grossularia]